MYSPAGSASGPCTYSNSVAPKDGRPTELSSNQHVHHGFLVFQLPSHFQCCIRSIRESHKEQASRPPSRRTTPILRLPGRYSVRAEGTRSAIRPKFQQRSKIKKLARPYGQRPLYLFRHSRRGCWPGNPKILYLIGICPPSLIL